MEGALSQSGLSWNLKVRIKPLFFRQFYSLAAELETTRQSLLKAEVSFCLSNRSLFLFIVQVHPVCLQETGDFSRLPKRMGQVYNMAMIRQVFFYKASEMSILNLFLDRFPDHHPIYRIHKSPGQ